MSHNVEWGGALGLRVSLKRQYAVHQNGAHNLRRVPGFPEYREERTLRHRDPKCEHDPKTETKE